MKSGIILITGGQRSGKSSFAQKLALEKSNSPIYLATARVWDNDFKQRIAKHRADRDEKWQNLESEKYIHKIQEQNRVIVLDCITLWLTNIFHDNDYKPEPSLRQAREIWASFIKLNNTVIVVTNELGMGVHPEKEAARKFADIQGWMNQYIAGSANTVYLMVSGIPVKIK